MHLKEIHFVGVILGQVYLAAEFVNGTVRHFWLQNPPAWQAGHVYQLGEMVQPSVPNGYYYQAPAGANITAWAPGTVYGIGDTVQPVVPNGYTYTVVSVTGTPTSGADEPVWPTSEGAQVFEGTETTTIPSNGALPTGGGVAINPIIRDRYNIDPSNLR